MNDKKGKSAGRTGSRSAKNDCEDNGYIVQNPENYSFLDNDPFVMEDDVFRPVERLLRLLHKNQDIDNMIQEMRFRFLTPEALFSSGRHVWQSLGLNPAKALLMSKLMDIARFQECDKYSPHPNMKTLKIAAPFMATCFFGMISEHFYMFCLNHRGRLKERVMLHEGDSEASLFATRKMFKELIDIRPYAIVLAHNHPGGTLRPSQDDIICTYEALKMLKTLGMPVVDHVILAQRQVVSMRLNSFVPERYWIEQDPKNHLLRNWLADVDPEEAVLDTRHAFGR